MSFLADAIFETHVCSTFLGLFTNMSICNRCNDGHNTNSSLFFILFNDFRISLDLHHNVMVRLLEFLGLKTGPVPLNCVVIALGNIVSTLVALSTKASRVIGSGLVVAFPGIWTLSATVKVALITHEGGLVLPGIMITLLNHFEVCHDLLNLERRLSLHVNLQPTLSIIEAAQVLLFSLPNSHCSIVCLFILSFILTELFLFA